MRNPNALHTIPTGHPATVTPSPLVVSVLASGSTNNVQSRVPNGCEYRAEHELSKAAHRPDVCPVGGSGDGDVVRCFGTFVETNHGRSLSLDTTVVHRIREEMYFTKGVPTMGDHTHPMEGAILDFSITRMRLIDLFNRDGEVCDEEQAALELFDDAKQTVKHLHHIDQASETYKKQYRSGITRYGKEKWELAGLKVEAYQPDDAA